MKSLTQEQIREISQQFDCGNCCYWNKKTGKLIFTPDFDENIYAEKEFYEEELDELENNWGDYVEIEKPNSKDNFEIMVNFAEHLDDSNQLKNKLFNAINKKKPFREFKFVVDNSGKYRQQWFDFKSSQLEKWVVERFNKIPTE